jgi:hypothetical protein
LYQSSFSVKRFILCPTLLPTLRQTLCQTLS